MRAKQKRHDVTPWLGFGMSCAIICNLSFSLARWQSFFFHFGSECNTLLFCFQMAHAHVCSGVLGSTLRHMLLESSGAAVTRAVSLKVRGHHKRHAICTLPAKGSEYSLTNGAPPDIDAPWLTFFGAASRFLCVFSTPGIHSNSSVFVHCSSLFLLLCSCEAALLLIDPFSTAMFCNSFILHYSSHICLLCLHSLSSCAIALCMHMRSAIGVKDRLDTVTGAFT